MYCSKCGKEIDASIIFCPQCGSKQNSINTDEDDWYCIIDNARKGPYKVNEIISEVSQGNVNRDSLVWKKGMENWMPARQSSISYIFQSCVPSIPDEIINNKFVWALATVPIFTSWILAEIIGSPDVVVIITIILNIVFMTLDVNELKKAEKKAENWLWLGIVLVPLYLFIRASKTDKKYGYAITWCVMFLLDLTM